MPWKHRKLNKLLPILYDFKEHIKAYKSVYKLKRVNIRSISQGWWSLQQSANKQTDINHSNVHFTASIVLYFYCPHGSFPRLYNYAVVWAFVTLLHGCSCWGIIVKILQITCRWHCYFPEALKLVHASPDVPKRYFRLRAWDLDDWGRIADRSSLSNRV